jgi:hypothetical protein
MNLDKLIFDVKLRREINIDEVNKIIYILISQQYLKEIFKLILIEGITTK